MTDPSSTALITGAASGIGQALARLLAQRDVNVGLVDIDEDGLERLTTELPGATAVTGDVADPNTFLSAADRFGAVDLLCLNAGVLSTDMGAPWEASPAEWERVIGINLLGVVNGLRAFVPLMLDRGTPCRILITASLAGAATWPGGGPYAASKHAVLAVAEQAALALADTNITVTVLCPALVRTGMSDAGADPADVAADALAALDDGRFAVVPDEWASAIRLRADTLVTGRQPTVPTPG